MKFSLWNFKDWYEKHGVDLSYFISDNSASITMLAAEESACEGCAVVQSGNQFEDCTGFHTALKFGSNRILFPVASPVEALNLGNAMIEYFTRWETSLFDRIADGCSIEELIASCQEQFPFPMALFHANGEVECQTADWAFPLSGRVARAVTQSAFQHRRATPPFFNTIFINQSYTFLSDAVKSDGLSPRILIAYEGTNRLQPGDVHIFHTIAETLQTAFRFHAGQRESERPLYRWYENFIQENAVNPYGVNRVMPDAGWREEDFYLIAAVAFEKEGPAVSLSHLLHSLSDANHCCVATDYGVSALIRLGSDWRSGLYRETDRISGLCSEKNIKIGLGLPFSGLLHLEPFYRQSLRAVRCALERDAFLISCLDILPELILSSCRALPDMRSMIRPDMLRLAEEDSREGGKLMKTLYAYLISGCSSSKTADALRIHRNTLRHRLEKIRALTSADLTDPETQNQLLLSMLPLAFSDEGP